MGRSKKGIIKGGFFPVTFQMIDSQAWQSLSGNSIMVFLQLMRKRNGYNDRDLSLTYIEMKIKLSPTTFRKCIKELVEKGFIDLVEQGGLQKQCNIYGVSGRWQNYGTNGFEIVTLEKWNCGGFGEMWKKKKAEERLNTSIENEVI